MPRIPTYQPGQVANVQTTNARFRTPDMAESGLGRGLQVVGKALGDYAVTQDHIDAVNDDTQARKMAAEAHVKMASITQQYGSLLGGNARTAQPDTLAQLDKVRSDLVAQASNPRMAQMLEERLGAVYADNVEAVSGHSLKQAGAERSVALQSTVDMSADSAVKTDDAEKRVGFIQSGTMAVNQFLDHQGIVDPAARAVALRKFTSNVWRGVADRELAKPNRDVHLVQTILAAHRDEMTDTDVLALEKDLQAPLKAEMVDSAYVRAMAGVEPVATPGASGDLATRMTPITENAESRKRDRNPDGSMLTSPKGAMGRMQVMPATARDPGFGIKPWDGKSDDDLARVGVQLQNTLLKRYGDPAKAWAAYNWGHGNVDKAVAERGAAWMSDPRMPAETRNYVQNNMAALGAHSSQAPVQHDKDEAFRRIDTQAKAEGWSFEFTQDVKEHASKQIARDEDLFRRQREAADDNALREVLKLGDGFTSINQLPRQVRDQLSPEATLRYQKVAEGNAAPKAAKPNSPEVMTLNIMRISEPDKFATTNLAEMVGKVTPAELDTLLTEQARIRAEKSKPTQQWNPSSGITEALSYGQRIGNLDLKDADKSAVMQVMEAEANRLHSEGKPVDYNALFQHATRNVHLKGFFGSSETPLYKLSLSNMRDDQRKDLTDKYKQVFGKEPSDDELLRFYRTAPR